MARRTPETLADYIVVGVAPALIITLIASLVFFLIGVFYQGEFPYRLTWVMGLFVLATVCVARISMEEGAGYAALFGLPLGVVVGIAVVYFVQIEGPLAPFSALINWGLLALIWWCAHQLTWDCTLIDDRRDTTGQGLLQSMGWDEASSLENGRSASDSAAEASSDPQTADGAVQDTRPAWWQKLFQQRDQPAAHGRWVVYFSVAALPLFGLGQFFIPVADTAGRRFAFWMLVIYVGSALGLLLTTSFLGLRRYIRQRQLEMPVEMAAVWLGVGVAMIVGLLAASALLPRPAPEYSIADAVQQRVGRFSSPDRSASRMSVGPEGTKSDGQPASAAGTDESSSPGTSAPENGARSGGTEGNRSSESAANSAGENQPENGPNSGSGTGESEQSQSGSSSSAGQDSGSNRQDSKSPEPSDNTQGNPGESSEGSPSGSGQGSASSAAGNRTNSSGESESDSPQGQAASGPSSEAEESNGSSSTTTANGSTSPSQAPSSSPTVLQQAFANLGNLLRYAFYAAVAIIAAVLAWKYRHELLAAWQQLLKELSELWARWLGRKNVEVRPSEEATASIPTKTFRDFPNPFATGQAARMTPPQLVQYSFEALQAWGRDFAQSRETGQTPHEFSEALGLRQPTIDTPARQLAEIYSRMAYARQAPPPQTGAILQTLWQAMNDVAHRSVSGGTAGRPVGSV